MQEADFQLQQSFEQGAGRGERILALSRYQQDESLQRQLRMVQFLRIHKMIFYVLSKSHFGLLFSHLFKYFIGKI